MSRPVFVLMYPQCSECGEDLNHQVDYWLCEECGSTWPVTANDGDECDLRGAES